MTHKVVLISKGKRIEQASAPAFVQRRAVAEAWLIACPGIREGRASVREELARDLHARGMIRAADTQYDIAKQIREGKL